MTTATAGGERMMRATITLPRWGVWSADVQVASGQMLSGSVDIELAGITLTGTVVDGDVYRETGWYRILGGAAGWRSSIPKQAYRNEAGVKLSTVLTDAAQACGESLGTVPSTQIGPAFVRPEGEAARVLELLSPEDWYVDEAGDTQLGHRAAAEWTADYTLIRKAPGNRLVTVAAEDVSALLPGAELEGIEAATVRHELTPAGLRSHVWGVVEPWADRALGALRSLVTGAMWRTDYHRVLEYKVNSVSAGYCDLTPMRTSLGLPDLSNIPMRPGIPGGGGDPQVGSSALVAFLDGEPTRPVILAFEGESGNGWKPTTARLNASSKVEVGKDANTVELAGGAQFLALENLVKAQLDSIQSALTTHTHSGVTAGAGVTGPSNSAYVAGQVKATKTKGT